MVYIILLLLFLVGVIGYQWTELEIIKETLHDEQDFNAELDPVELYWEDRDG